MGQQVHLVLLTAMWINFFTLLWINHNKMEILRCISCMLVFALSGRAKVTKSVLYLSKIGPSATLGNSKGRKQSQGKDIWWPKIISELRWVTAMKHWPSAACLHFSFYSYPSNNQTWKNSTFQSFPLCTREESMNLSKTKLLSTGIFPVKPWPVGHRWTQYLPGGCFS